MITKQIAQINPHEMALRIAEACIGARREPEGASAYEVLQEMAKQYPDEVRGFYRAALAAAKYLEESINDMQAVQ